MTAAALTAGGDLAAAAISMQQLGTLTSGMWRALSRELDIAAGRLDRQSQEYLDTLYRRAQALEVAPDAVRAAGVAAGHLAEHRETLEALLPTLAEDVRRLSAPEVLLGFSIDDEVLVEEEDELDAEDEANAVDDSAVKAEEEASAVSPLAMVISLFLWPVPLTPARVTIVPRFAAGETATEPDLSVGVCAGVADAAVDALTTTCGLPRENVLPALSALAMACWSAHQADERGDDDDDDDDEADDGDGE